jgi:predicted ester cyclase
MASFLAERDPLGSGSVKERRSSMSTEENKHLVRRLFDAVNHRSLDDLDTLLGPDFLLNGEPVSPDDFKAFVDWHVSVLTEVRFAIEDLIAEGDKVVARLQRQGTHQGWLDVEPTGMPTSTRGIYIFRVADGKLVEAWDAWDELGLLGQIGAVWKVEREGEAGSV